MKQQLPVSVVESDSINSFNKLWCDRHNKPRPCCHLANDTHLWRSAQRGLLGKYVKYTMFVTFFTFPQPTWRPDPQPIFTQNDLNDMDSRIDMPFAVKIEFFSTPWPPGPENRQNLALLGLDFTFNFSGLKSKHPLVFNGAP